jgi:hypothetical protein
MPYGDGPDIYFVYHPSFEKQVKELALAVSDLIPEEVNGELAIEPGPARYERERLLSRKARNAGD